jgi:formate dehydrogenase maturation protein FdhE
VQGEEMHGWQFVTCSQCHTTWPERRSKEATGSS